MTVDESDVFGGAVNFAARVVGSIEKAEIWLSERAKDDLDRGGARQHAGRAWRRIKGVPMKGFPTPATLWALGPEGA